MANLNFLRGSSTNWASLTGKSSDTFYIVEYKNTGDTTEKYELYLGDKLIADGSTLEQLLELTKRVSDIDEVTSKVINNINLACGFDEEVKYTPKNELITGATSLAEAIEIIAQKSSSLDGLNSSVTSDASNLVSVSVVQTEGKLTSVAVDDTKLDEALTAITTNIETVSSKTEANTSAIAVLNGTGDGSVTKTVNDAKAELIGDATDNGNTLGKLEDKIDEISNNTKTYSIKKIDSGLTSNVREAYQLVDEDGAQCGEQINIYKDSSLQSVKLSGQSLVFTYILSDGSESEVSVDISIFLAESEFKDGLQVNENGEVSVKKDDTSESFLTVSADGIKISGIQDAIDTKISSLDTNVTSTGGSFVTVTVTETDGLVNDVKVEETNIASASDLESLTTRVGNLEAKTISAKTDSNIEVTKSGDVTTIGLVWGTF